MSKQGYFENDYGLSENDLDGIQQENLESAKSDLEEDFDAFNEETFANTELGNNDEYDWETEHEKLIALENNDQKITQERDSSKDAVEHSKILNQLNESNLKQQNYEDNAAKSLPKIVDKIKFKDDILIVSENQYDNKQISHYLNEIQLKLLNELKIQNELQQQLVLQIKLIQQQFPYVGQNDLLQQKIIQQIKLKQQQNSNAIFNLVTARNDFLKKQVESGNNTFNKSFGKTQRQTSEQTSFQFKNAERINFYQPDTSNTKINDKNNSREVFEKLKQQLYLSDTEKLENVGMRQNLEKLQNQVQAQKSRFFCQYDDYSKLPHLTKNLPNAKTLEEIENELLNEPKTNSLQKINKDLFNQQSTLCSLDNKAMHQLTSIQNQQNLEILKMLPLINLVQSQSQNNSNFNSNEFNNILQFNQQKQILQLLALQEQQKIIQPTHLQHQTTIDQTQHNQAQRHLQRQHPEISNYQRKNPIKDSFLKEFNNENVEKGFDISTNKFFKRSDENLRILKESKNQFFNSQEKLKIGNKLNGMMTDKEKNWVVNVQMLQLKIDDPYTYDFYYTTWMSKKKNINSFQFMKSEQNPISSDLTNQNKVIGNSAHQKNESKNYRPLTFENSLGKVTMSNFHHPRALIDIHQAGNHINNQPNPNQLFSQVCQINEQDDQKENKNISTILFEIEKINIFFNYKMYQVYILIDEIEHKILKEPEEMRSCLFQERRSKVDKLALMMCSENFPHYLFIQKGKRLLGKCLPTFNINQNSQILGYFMQYIYIISRNKIILDEIYAQICYAIDTQKFNDLVNIVQQFVCLYSKQSNETYITIFSNKFALTYLLKFVSKSDLVNQDDYDNEVKTIWSDFINLVLYGLSILDDKTTKKPSLYENFQIDFKNLITNFNINMELWMSNEAKIKEYFITLKNE